MQDCDELLDDGIRTSGVYWIRGTGPPSDAVQGFCDQTSRVGEYDPSPGGWTLLTTFQEQSRPEGFSGFGTYAKSKDRMWIKGCGVRGSIGCYGRGPDFPGYVDGRRTAMRSLDWRAMLEQGHEYELRVTMGVRSWSDGAMNSSFLDQPFTYAFSGFLDVYYGFRYPGWVLQDENGGGQDVQDLGWALGPATSMSDETYANWASAEETVFYPPYSAEYRHMVINACDGFQHALYDQGPCTASMVGGAGIINTRTAGARRDPIGSCECTGAASRRLLRSGCCWHFRSTLTFHRSFVSGL